MLKYIDYKNGMRIMLGKQKFERLEQDIKNSNPDEEIELICKLITILGVAEAFRENPIELLLSQNIDVSTIKIMGKSAKDLSIKYKEYILDVSNFHINHHNKLFPDDKMSCERIGFFVYNFLNKEKLVQYV